MKILTKEEEDAHYRSAGYHRLEEANNADMFPVPPSQGDLQVALQDLE